MIIPKTREKSAENEEFTGAGRRKLVITERGYQIKKRY